MYVDAAAAAAMFHGTFETVFIYFLFIFFGFPSGICVHKSKILYIHNYSNSIQEFIKHVVFMLYKDTVYIYLLR